MKPRLLAFLAIFLTLAACSGAGQGTPEIPTPFDGGKIQPPEAAVQAQIALAGVLGVSSDQIQIRDIQSAEWPDACLDAGTPDEICAQVITPGYRVVLAYGEELYTYHTDLAGDQVLSVQRVAEPSEAALQSRQLLAAMLGLNPDTVRIVSEESVRYADSCLEISIPETVCAQVQVLGKRITLEADNHRFEYRSADEPVAPVLAVADGIQAGHPVIMLTREGGIDEYCDQLNITLSGKVIQYTCRNVPGTLPGISELSAENQAQLLKWVLKYSPYDITQTRQDGVKIRLTFMGTGPDAAQFEEQETIRQFSESLLRMPRPFATPLPTSDAEN